MISSHGTASIIRGAFWTASVAVMLVALYPVAIKVQRRRQSSRPVGINVVRDPPDANFEIVAVHGLGAHPEHTLEGKPTGEDQAKSHLLRDLLSRDFPTARILRFAYNSDWLVDAPEKTAQQIGQGLLNELSDYRGKIKTRHSFGGIVIKEALCVVKRHMTIRDDTCGIVFLGTPHQGSSLSTAGALVANLTGFLGSNTTLLLALRSHESQLLDLEHRFRHLVSDQKRDFVSKIISFCETKPTFMLRWLFVGLIVDQHSAMGYAAKPIDIDTDHSGLNKFSDCSHPGYRAIKKAIEELREPSFIEQADTWIRENHYNKEKLKIERLSGDLLQMDQCYINLALVELQRADSLERRSGEPALRSSPFSLSDRLKVETPHKDLQVELAKLFESRKLPDGRTKEPRRILIRGRAGVGKTTLCKKIVYNYIHKSMWRKHFTRVLWVQLRKLKAWSPREYNLGEMFRHIYLEQCQDGTAFARELWIDIEDAASRPTLFVLDGLDEVSELLNSDDNAFGFLVGLLNRPDVIITTRPHTTLHSDVKAPDLELDTIGFHPDQVQQYLKAVVPENAEKIQSFLRKNQLLQSLVRIPIQLDALCLTWNENLKLNGTMTAVYEAIVERLWKKDIKLRNKVKNTKGLLPFEVEKLVEHEKSLLGCLGFCGMYHNIIEFGTAHRDTICKHFQPQETVLPLDEKLGRLSFLRTSDPLAKPETQSYHFLHLTFQEFFAAKYFVRQWKDKRNLQYLSLNRRKPECHEISPKSFLQQYKYTARYDIFWRFVAGLLDYEGEDESTRFFEEIERKPVDLLGPAHQRLVMHCLSEAVSLPDEMRANREKRLKDWVLFEINFTGSSTFTRESELPDEVLQGALSASRNKRVVLDSLQYPRRYMSETTMTALVELFKDEDSGVRSSAADALGKQPTLSETTMTALVELLKHENTRIRSSAAKAVGSQSNFIGKVLDAFGLLIQSESQGGTRASVLCCFQHIEHFYEIFLWRSLQEQFSLCINNSLCIVNQPSGLRTASLGDSSQVEAAVQNTRCHLENSDSYKLWDTFDGEDA